MSQHTQPFFLTTLSIKEMRILFRTEMENFFATNDHSNLATCNAGKQGSKEKALLKKNPKPNFQNANGK